MTKPYPYRTRPAQIAWSKAETAWTMREAGTPIAAPAEFRPNRQARRLEARRQKQARHYLIKIAGEVTARRNAKIAARAAEEDEQEAA